MLKTLPKSSIAIKLLGNCEIIYDSVRIEKQIPQKGIALLAYLASQPGKPETRQKLAGLFWPEIPKQAARNNLRQVLLGLRRCLEKDLEDGRCLVADRHSVRYEPSKQHNVDLVEFISMEPECATDKDRETCQLIVAYLIGTSSLHFH